MIQAVLFDMGGTLHTASSPAGRAEWFAARLIERLGDWDRTVAELDRFLPYVDNWATCDLMRPQILSRCMPKLRQKAAEWIRSPRPYNVRFGIEMLMTYGLNEEFSADDPETVAQVRSEEYYVQMMVAWYFATALAKRYDTVLPYLTAHRLETPVHNKAIQKAIESRRITEAQKRFLRSLKIKA